MNLRDELESQWVDLVGELDLTIEQGQEILNLHRRQLNTLLETYDSMKDADQ